TQSNAKGRERPARGSLVRTVERLRKPGSFPTFRCLALDPDPVRKTFCQQHLWPPKIENPLDSHLENRGLCLLASLPTAKHRECAFQDFGREPSIHLSDPAKLFDFPPKLIASAL